MVWKSTYIEVNWVLMILFEAYCNWNPFTRTRGCCRSLSKHSDHRLVHLLCFHEYYWRKESSFWTIHCPCYESKFPKGILESKVIYLRSIFFKWKVSVCLRGKRKCASRDSFSFSCVVCIRYFNIFEFSNLNFPACFFPFFSFFLSLTPLFLTIGAPPTWPRFTPHLRVRGEKCIRKRRCSLDHCSPHNNPWTFCIPFCCEVPSYLLWIFRYYFSLFLYFISPL